MNPARLLLPTVLCFLVPATLGADCDGSQRSRLHQHVLDRIGFGPDAWARDRIDELGARRYILEQLRPDTIDDSEFEARLASLPMLDASYAELRDGVCEGCSDIDPDGALHRAVDAKILRSIVSRRQLEAVLEDFWFDHFNVDARRGMAMPGLIPYLRDAIRPHLLGKFEDLLLAVARAPAMLDYLDNRLNFRDGTVGGDGIVRGINENFSREFLELHTVGRNSGFSQRDVREVARAFTGWTVNGQGFNFRAQSHDEGAKRILGSLFLQPGGGIEDGEAVIEFLAAHSATAERVSRLLVRRFVSEDPPEELVDAAASNFRLSGGDLRRVMRVILMSDEFSDPVHFGGKVKRPTVLLASTMRATASRLPAARLLELRKELESMGEAPYQAPTPKGYPDDSTHWASAGSFLSRLRFVNQVASRSGVEWPEGAGSDLSTSLELADRLFAGGAPRSVAQVYRFLRETSREPARVRVSQAGGLLLSSPEFFQH